MRSFSVRSRPLAVAVVVLLGFAGSAAWAEDGLDAHTELALRQTQELLRNPGKRDESVQRDAKAKEADAKVREVAGSAANTEAMYALAAEVLESMVRESGGDATKLQELLQSAQSNPEAFYKALTPEQRARVKQIAEQIPAR